MKMKTYQRPTIEAIPADANILSDSLTIGLYDKDPKTVEDPDDWFITDGSQILSPKINLWEEE